MKKIISIIMAAAMAAAMAGCGKTTDADMSKVDGTAVQESEQEDGAAAGTLANCDIEIKDSKIIETSEGKALVVSIDFTNNNTNEKSFDGLFSVTAAQDGAELTRASAVTPQDGIDLLAVSTMVKHGDSATVQYFFELNDEETDVVVDVYRYNDASEGIISKTFSL